MSKGKRPNIPFSEIKRKYPRSNENQKEKKSILQRLLILPFRFVGATLGIDKDTISSYNKSANNTSKVGNSYQLNNSPESLREQYHFDPEKWAIKEMQAEAYNALVDGKGDHECNCGHDEK